MSSKFLHHCHFMRNASVLSTDWCFINGLNAGMMFRRSNLTNQIIIPAGFPTTSLTNPTIRLGATPTNRQATLPTPSLGPLLHSVSSPSAQHLLAQMGWGGTSPCTYRAQSPLPRTAHQIHILLIICTYYLRGELVNCQEGLLRDLNLPISTYHPHLLHTV